MGYKKTNWISGKTPCSADNFNNMEDGIEQAHLAIDELNDTVSRIIKALENTISDGNGDESEED